MCIWCLTQKGTKGRVYTEKDVLPLVSHLLQSPPALPLPFLLPRSSQWQSL